VKAKRHISRTISAFIVTTAIVAAGAPAASAGVLVKTTTNCGSETYSQPFARFGDTNRYTPLPGGSFEPGDSAWTLSGGAKLVSGNESFAVRSTADRNSLYLPAGAVATSPAMCVGLDHPSIRWFAKQSGSLLGLTGSMTVEVLFEDSLGQVLALPIGAGLLSTSWQPSLPGIVTANLLPLLPGAKTPVAFRFRAVTGNWNVDDVYVDPIQRW
jgi:hypothetical protein